MKDLFNDNGAKFSDDRFYRYALWRIWDRDKAMMMFIGLNPSTANETTDDPTIRRVKRFAKDWGYGGVFMTNLFAFVTAYPEELLKCDDPVGDNDLWLKEIARECKDILFAWGSFNVNGRDKEIIEKFPLSYVLGVNKDGSPKHPLYIKADTKPIFLKVAQERAKYDRS